MIHLQNELLVGVLTRSAEPADLAHATAHLAWCASCRNRAEVLAVRIEAQVPAAVEVPSDELLSQATAAALKWRTDHAMWPKFVRHLGLRTGASQRPLRLALTTLSVLAAVWMLVAQWNQHLVAGRPDVDELVLAVSPQLLAGSQTSVSLTILPPKQVAPAIAGKRQLPEHVPVTLRLLSDKHAVLATAQGEIGPSGATTLQLKVPQQQAQKLPALLVAELPWPHELRHVDRLVTLIRQTQQHLSVDKPTYQPGQVAHLRALSLDRGSGLPLAAKSARLEVFDPRGTRLARQQAVVSAQGVSSMDFELSPGAALGTYKAIVKVDDVQAETTFKVERYVLPPFTVKATPLAASTDGTKPFDVEVTASYTTGTPLSVGQAHLQVTLADDVIYSAELPLKAGLARFTVPKTRRHPSGGILQLHATVTDPGRRAEQGSGRLAFTGDALQIQLASEAPSLRLNLPKLNKILVRLSRPDGTPVQAMVSLFSPGQGELEVPGSGENVAQGQTGADGMATLDLAPAFFGRPLAVQVTDPKDNMVHWQSFAAPPVRQGALILRCDKSLLRVGDSLQCDVFAPSDKARLLHASVDGQVVAMTQVPAHQGITSVSLKVPDTATGLLRLSMDDAPPDDGVFALAAPKEGLRVNVHGLQTHKPGDELALQLKVTDAKGAGRAAAVGLALVDAAVYARMGGEMPAEVLAALFVHGGTTAELAALAFPEQPAADLGATGPWTLTQQAQARWVLKLAQAAKAELDVQTSLDEDQATQRRARSVAEQRADFARLAAIMLFILAFVVFTLWASPVLRRLAFALLCAMDIGLILLIVVDNFGFHPEAGTFLACLSASLAGAYGVWRRGRPDLVSGQATLPRRRRIGEAAFATALLLGIATWFSNGKLSERSTGKFYSNSNAMPESTSTFEIAIEEKEERKADMAPPAPAAVPLAAADKKALGEVYRGNTIAGAFSASSKLFAAGDSGDDVAAKELGGGPGHGAAAPALRQDFPETLYFNPGVVTGPDGTAEVKVHIADSLTTWELHAVASDAAGALGTAQGQLPVRKDFYVELDTPRDLSVGDAAAIQVTVHNEREQPALAKLTAQADGGVQVDQTRLQAPLPVNPRGVNGLTLPLTATLAGPQGVTLTGLADTLGDAIKRVIAVYPDGREIRKTASGLLSTEVERTLDIPQEALPYGRTVAVTLLPGPMADALESLEATLAEPHGCFEQTTSITVADALVLQTMRALKRIAPEKDADTLRLLRLGYQDMLAYELPDGGFSYFGHGEADTFLNMYAVLALNTLSGLIDVDTAVIARTQKAVLAQQDAQGGFGSPAQTAFAAWVLWETDKDWSDKEDPGQPWPEDVRARRTSCQRLQQRMIDSFSVTQGVDSYALALAANAWQAAGTLGADKVPPLLDELQRRAVTVSGEDGPRSSYGAKAATLSHAYGPAQEVETTALVATAALRSTKHAALAKDALRALLALRDDRGGFQSTHGEFLALRALLVAAGTGNEGGQVAVLVDGREVATVALDAAHLGQPQRVDLSEKVANHALIKLRVKGWNAATGDLGYRLTTRYWLPWANKQLQPPLAANDTQPRLSMQQWLDRSTVRLGEKVHLWLHAVRTDAGSSRGMMLVEVGLPPGFRLSDEADRRLHEPPIARVEPAARGMLLYLEDFSGNSQLDLDLPLIADRAVRRVKVPRSRAWYYYQPEVEAFAAPLPILVSP